MNKVNIVSRIKFRTGQDAIFPLQHSIDILKSPKLNRLLMNINICSSIVAIAIAIPTLTSCAGQAKWEIVLSPNESTQGWTRYIDQKSMKSPQTQHLKFNMRSVLGKEDLIQSVEIRCDAQGFATEYNVDSTGYRAVPSSSDIEKVGLKLCNS